MTALALALKYLPQIIAAGKTLWDYVEELRAAALQTDEWTDEHEAQFQAALLAKGQSAESQPDDALVAPEIVMEAIKQSPAPADSVAADQQPGWTD